MTVQAFRDLLQKRPFQAFRVVMSSGERYEVRHPEMAWLTRTMLYVGTGTHDGIPEETAMCSLPHITAVEPIKNGRSTRRRSG